MIYETPRQWIVVFCNTRARKELEEMPAEIQADFARLVQLIQIYGLENVREPHVKHLAGKLWELRLKGPDGIARAIYITAKQKRVVILHSFTKKTQQTPKGALDLALRRAKEEGYL